MKAKICITIILICCAFTAINMFISSQAIPKIYTGPVLGSILYLFKWMSYIIALGILIRIGKRYAMASIDERIELQSVVIRRIIIAAVIAAIGVSCTKIFVIAQGAV